MNPLLEIRTLNKSFGTARILNDVSLSVRQGEFMTLLGPSGCGKTTTLRIVAGFEDADSGAVLINGVDVTSKPAFARDVHTVFQHYALFPHLDVFENVAFGLRLQKSSESEITTKVFDALGLVKLRGYERRNTASLSGGQMQRVALARAIVGRPALLLLDEPLGALDLKLRKEMQLELKNLQRRLGIAFVYVTHDQEEAMTMSDRIAVFNHGRIEQIGSPEEIYESPRTSFVADFIGGANLYTATVLSGTDGLARLKLEDEFEIEVPLDPGESLPAVGRRVRLAIRPERVKVSYHGQSTPGALRFDSVIRESVFVGDGCQLYLEFLKSSPDKRLVAVAGGARAGAHGERDVPAVASVMPEDVYILESDA